MSPSERVPLEVVAADAATELFVVDGDFNLVDRGIGRHTFDLAPGIYKVKARTGIQQEEQLVMVRAGVEPVHFDALRFASPIPLDDTADADEAGVALAQRAVAHVHLRVDGDGGSAIVLVARARGAQGNPVQGVRLLRMDGTSVADVEALAERGGPHDESAIFHVELPPGGYRVALDLADGRRIEQTLIAAPGWQTRVYVVATPDRAELANAAISMHREGTPFLRADADTRLEEIARQALLYDRKVLSAELRARLLAPDVAPILGILGMHLLVREAKRNKRAREENPTSDIAAVDNTAAVQTIIANLRHTIGTHPDVEAVALGAGVANAKYVFDTPPMLTLSWRLLLKATAAQPQLLPAGSFGERIATRLWGKGIWLQWIERDSLTAADRDTAWQEKARRMLRHLGHDTEVVAPAPAVPAVSSWITSMVDRFVTKHPEHAAVKSIAAQAQVILDNAVFDVKRVRAKLDAEGKKRLVKQLGIPMAAVEAWLNDLETKN